MNFNNSPMAVILLLASVASGVAAEFNALQAKTLQQTQTVFQPDFQSGATSQIASYGIEQTSQQSNDVMYDGSLAIGGDGDDWFYGDSISNGALVIDGGAGYDAIMLYGNSTEFTLTDHGDGRYQLTDNRPNAPEGDKTITNVEVLAFGDVYMEL